MVWLRVCIAPGAQRIDSLRVLPSSTLLLLGRLAPSPESSLCRRWGGNGTGGFRLTLAGLESLGKKTSPSQLEYI